MTRVSKHSTKSAGSAMSSLDENSRLTQTVSDSMKSRPSKTYSPSKRIEGLSPSKKSWSRSDFSIFSESIDADDDKENIPPKNLISTSVAYTDDIEDKKVRKPLRELSIAEVPGYIYVGGTISSGGVRLSTQWNNRSRQMDRAEIYQDLPSYVTPPRASVVRVSSFVSRNIESDSRKQSSAFRIYHDISYRKSSVTIGLTDNKENVPPKLIT